MPKRSNQFQRLVALLHNTLDKHWTITESEMFVHTLTGEKREVDIVCKSKLGNYETIISIECTDTKRPASSTWVESMICKHSFLPKSKLVLWSGNGFFKPAIKMAEMLNIETVTPQRDVQEEWAKFANVFKNGTIKLIQPVLSHFVDYTNHEGINCRLEGKINYLIRDNEINTTIHIDDVKMFILEKEEVRTCLLDHATEENQDFWIKFEPRSEWEVQREDGEWVTPFRIGFGIKANTHQQFPLWF